MATTDTALLGQMDDYILDGKYHTFYKKRTLSTDCYDLYYRHFVN